MEFSDEHDATGFDDLVSALDGLGNDELTEHFRELELAQRRLAAEMAATITVVDRRGVYRDDGHRSLAGWLRAHCNYSGAQVLRLGRVARLVAGAPEVGDHLAAGRVGADQVAELARAFANPRCGQLLPESLGILSEHAQRMKFNDFRACVQRWEMLADLEGAHRDRGDAVQARRAAVIAGIDGVDVTATGGTALQATQMAAIFEAFAEAEFKRDTAELRERLGAQAPSSELSRTGAQRRFDALMVIFNSANDYTGDRSPAPATVNIVCDQHTYESAMARHGLADEPADLPVPGPARARCNTTAGVPLLPDDVVLAALGGWVRRVVMNSAGVVTDMGRRSRLFAGTAAEAAALLATGCEIPGCQVPQHWTQIDHITEWVDQGRTDQDNAALACGRDNRRKHRQRLKSRRDRFGKLHVQRPDGTWITPVGADPPTEDDFLTDDQIAEHVRQRLFELRPRV
jgi:hypothetical protein